MRVISRINYFIAYVWEQLRGKKHLQLHVEVVPNLVETIFHLTQSFILATVFFETFDLSVEKPVHRLLVDLPCFQGFTPTPQARYFL